jgi:hypothetical protein
MNPLATTFGPVNGDNVFAGNHVSGGSLNVTINNSRCEAASYWRAR